MCSKKGSSFLSEFLRRIMYLLIIPMYMTRITIFYFCILLLSFIFCSECVCSSFIYMYVFFQSFEVFLSLTVQCSELPQTEQHLLLFCPLSKMTKTFPIMDISASKNTISKFTQPLLDNKMWLVFISSTVFLVE